MKTRHSLLISILLIPLLGYSRTPNWEVVTLNHQLYQDVVFNQLVGDTMVVHAYGKTFEIPVDSIQSIRDVNGPYGHEILGFMIGVIGGGIIGICSHEELAQNQDDIFIVVNMLHTLFINLAYIAVGSIIGGLSGVIVGGSIKTDKYYDFSKYDHAGKIEIINQLMQPYVMKPIFDSRN